MSDAAQHTQYLMVGIAIYQTRGIVEALYYLQNTAGWTFTEAMDMLDEYEKFRNRALAGVYKP